MTCTDRPSAAAPNPHFGVRGSQRIGHSVPVAEVDECFVCDKHQRGSSVAGGVLYEDDIVYAGHVVGSSNRTYLGHLVAEPKRHVEGLDELSTDEAEALGRLVQQLAVALRASEGAQGVSTFVFGDGRVQHVHIHVVPLYRGTPTEYRAAKVLEWPDAPRGDVADITATCDRLRAHLS
jgi:histidine triad (HIT) family protein